MSFHQGFLAGKQWTPVELAAIGAKHGWADAHLVEFVAVSLSESAGRERAHCFNYRDEKLTVLYAEDIGLLQISRETDTPVPANDPLWLPDNNVAAARDLYERRGWQPWHGYTGFIATNPAMHGEYIQRAIWGVANYYRSLYGVPQLPYPKTGSKLRILLDSLTRSEHPLVPPFQSRATSLRPA